MVEKKTAPSCVERAWWVNRWVFHSFCYQSPNPSADAEVSLWPSNQDKGRRWLIFWLMNNLHLLTTVPLTQRDKSESGKSALYFSLSKSDPDASWLISLDSFSGMSHWKRDSKETPKRIWGTIHHFWSGKTLGVLQKVPTCIDVMHQDLHISWHSYL